MRCIFVIAMVTVTPFLSAQITEPPPDTLLDAGHCLAADHRDWLDVAREKPYEVELGFVSADPSDADKEKPFYLVEFTTLTHTEGFAFAFQSQGKGSHRSLLLQLRTRFRQTDDGSQRVSLVDPPLGGVGTQDQILSAIQQVGFHTWKVPVATLQKESGSVHCETSAAEM